MPSSALCRTSSRTSDSARCATATCSIVSPVLASCRRVGCAPRVSNSSHRPSSMRETATSRAVRPSPSALLRSAPACTRARATLTPNSQPSTTSGTPSAPTASLLPPALSSAVVVGRSSPITAMRSAVEPSSAMSSVLARMRSSGTTTAASPVATATWSGVRPVPSSWLRSSPIGPSAARACSSTSARRSSAAACSREPPLAVAIVDVAPWWRRSLTAAGVPRNKAASRVDSPREFIASTAAPLESSSSAFCSRGESATAAGLAQTVCSSGSSEPPAMASTWAPRASSSVALSTPPEARAASSGVRPWRSRQLTRAAAASAEREGSISRNSATSGRPCEKASCSGASERKRNRSAQSGV
mmetsp:Transcript_70187/g.210986  ORF Transcript_70187/g.210986 Transcript_70187/m.210986 type:complete len:359 (+) Transcript_70187:1636-2712(+)